MSMMAAYDARVNTGDIARDPAQVAVIESMTAFLKAWQNSHDVPPAGFMDKLFKKSKKPARGLYIYGGVGRGKTMMMDMLVSEANNPRVRRVHFHAFMLEIHGRLQKLRDAGKNHDNLLRGVARDIAADIDLLCFDEIHVNDIADAMILGPLFNNLMDGGVALVATSNYAPDDLYKDGLQRVRFLPFIELLKSHMDVVYLDSPIDYRARALSDHGTWFYPLGDQSWMQMTNLFEALTGNAATPAVTLDIEGRGLYVLRADVQRGWIEFDTLCREPRGAADYLVVGHEYHVVFIDNIPRMTEENRNELRRFMTLIDTLYDLGCIVVVRAAAAPADLYSGDSHAFEFQRTLSRLLEMQSPAWWAKKY